MASVLIVDDDRKIRLTLGIFLERRGYRVRDVASVKAALTALKEFRTDIVLSDLKMEGAGGIELLAAIKSEYPSLPVIIMTAYATVEKAVEAIKLGAADFIVKPFAPAEIEQVLSRNIHIQGLETENRNLRVALGKEDLITRSEVLRRTLVMAERFAHSEATVLILGESGTGKSMIARRIHVASARSKGPFVEVNCASLSPTLLESELFGHCKGAFTGAVKDKVGRLESADGGTLFLDEVSELSAEGQAKLLRFLQDKVFERVGEIKTRAVDTRIIAATNRDLCHLIGGEGFREDLYYRLNVAEVLMPPLRSRSEDIPLLAERFLAQAAARNGLSSIPAMEDEVKARIARYNWPGNVRELQNVIERCVILAGAGRITMEHLPDRLLTDTAP
ncbi:sigma-54 dependent transcriptional regulator [Acidiferrobacter sp.]|uniref:sigma-54-dependent transcriptional regulator n=1 Tax=Acidiferrobacter sp. TaxID=1872107 RepID=UPI00262F0DAB|nr:sigma-54 dependent transcriptional regulator [Acidiferrobacter sp.]